MRKLIAGCILIMALPAAAKAQTFNDTQTSKNVSGQSSEALPSGVNPSQTGISPDVDTESEAYQSCMRATQRFEQQEKAKGKAETAEAPISASCKTELKPASYWHCMEQEAVQEIDFNTAHWRCAKKANL